MDQALLTFLTAFVSSVVVLIGVILGNRHNSKENAKRLAFDLEIKEKDRFHNLKKDILFNATDELIRINKALGGLVNPKEMTVEDKNSYNTFLMAMNRISLVGNAETAKFANGLIKFYTDVYLELKLLSDKVTEVDNSIKINQHFFEKYTSEIDRIMNLMQLNFESDEGSDKRNEKYQITLENQIKHRDEINQELKELYELQDIRAKEVMLKLGDYLLQINQNSGNFILSARKEMLGPKEGFIDLENSEDVNEQFIKNYQDFLKNM